MEEMLEDTNGMIRIRTIKVFMIKLRKKNDIEINYEK
jgi:hypothetical protein